MNIDKLIEELSNAGILEVIQKKRMTTSELPASLYIKLLIASIATKKGASNCISTALETYCMRNEEKHLNEIKLQAAAAGKELEVYLVEAIATRLKSKDEG
ncbi:hypothetical protein G7B40_001525 [Aetokthonos hydrillicola Thurmond2011]|uniref:Uncharacterized protein n=1 Tax=Aetokthonos hydrillicola Thurmond2011 TaxID=2712845 RepID=A0AAP5I228_9CYAN|nr:hypothetical protein [Aetokthonos hydrillicola]MDR9893266.1 hypothetical protein [Aetokthonos hydrillicola Thurmond2011]